MTNHTNVNLPEEWKWGKLGDVCEFLDSRRVPVNETERVKRIAGKAQDELFPYYGANGQVGWIDDYLFDEPLILLAEDGGFFGSTDRPIAYAVSGRYWVNNHAHVLRPTAVVDFDYCLHALRIRPDVGDLVAGATRAKLNQEVAAKILLPLPPLPEQKRIAAILTEQMAQVEKARAAAKVQLAAVQTLPAAYLREVFDSEEARQWPRANLREVCEIVAIQVDPKLPEFGALPHVNGERILSGTCQIVDVKTASEDGMTSGKYLFGAGDVLYSKLRPYLRKAAIAPWPGVCSADMYPIRSDLGKVDREFLCWMLVSDSFTVYADNESRRARMPKLNRDQLFAYSAPLPTIALQQHLVAGLRQHFAAAYHASQTIRAQLDTINKLPAALLRQAFSGRL